MAKTKLTRKIINVASGEELEREFTVEEYEQESIDQANFAARKAEAEAKATAKASAEAKLAALGLTTNDLRALGL